MLKGWVHVPLLLRERRTQCCFLRFDPVSPRMLQSWRFGFSWMIPSAMGELYHRNSKATLSGGLLCQHSESGTRWGVSNCRAANRVALRDRGWLPSYPSMGNNLFRGTLQIELASCRLVCSVGRMHSPKFGRFVFNRLPKSSPLARGEPAVLPPLTTRLRSVLQPSRLGIFGGATAYVPGDAAVPLQDGNPDAIPRGSIRNHNLHRQ